MSQIKTSGGYGNNCNDFGGFGYGNFWWIGIGVVVLIVIIFACGGWGGGWGGGCGNGGGCCGGGWGNGFGFC